jgi:hypothetical protein
MADLTIPLIGLTTLVGYYFSKNGKDNRKQSKGIFTDDVDRRQGVRDMIETFDKPNGENIYTSNVVTEANDQVLKRSLQNYKDAYNPVETGVILPFFNSYSAVGLDPAKLEKDIKTLSSKELGELNDMNRIGKIESLVDNGIHKMPMFQSTVQFNESVDKENINILTGLSYEKEHNNMVPFFGSNTKQNVEGFSNVSLLDRYTGKSAEFGHKKEVESFYDVKPENINGMPSTTDVIKDRYIKSVYKQGERPFEQVHIAAPKAGTFENNIRPEFKQVNELRPGNNPKQTYTGVVFPGKMGEVRGVAPKVKKNRPPTFYEKTQDNLFKGPGAYIAPEVLQDYSLNLKPTYRKEYNIEYTGNAKYLDKFPQRIGNIDNSKELHEITDSLFQEPKRINYENDYVRNISTTKMVNDYGKSGMKQYKNERSTTEENFQTGTVQPIQKGNILKPFDKVKTTLKETTLRENDSGYVKASYTLNKSDPHNIGMSDMKPKDTQKQNLIDNKYLGQHTNGQNGLGYLTSKYDAKTTNKEIITENSNYKGNPHYKNETESRVQYQNADIRDLKQDLLMGQRPGGHQKFQISSGKVSFGQVKTTANLLLKEEQDKRSNMNARLPQIIPDKHIINMQGNKIEGSDDRFQPDLLKAQLAENPYVLNNNKN